MFCKVIKRFKDKYNGKIYEAGTKIDLEEKRAEELISADDGPIVKILPPVKTSGRRVKNG